MHLPQTEQCNEADKQVPDPGVHPDDAAVNGLAEGDLAELATPTGRLRARVALDPHALPGVAYCPKGHWPKQTDDNANVNTLNPGTPADMARSTSVHGIEVTVTATTSRLAGSP